MRQAKGGKAVAILSYRPTALPPYRYRSFRNRNPTSGSSRYPS